MSDQSQGPGWWQASDGKWYRPEQHPNYQPPAPAPPAPTPAAPTPPEPAPPHQDLPPVLEPPLVSPPADLPVEAPNSAPKASPLAGKSPAQLVVLGSAVAMAIGAFLPWAKVVFFLGTVSASGIDGGDGWFYVGGAAVLALLAWRGEPGWPILAVSVLGAAGFVWERYDIGTAGDEAGFSVSLGIGLWLIAATCIVAGGAAVHTLTAGSTGDVARPPLQRYWWGIGLVIALVVSTVVAGGRTHDDEGLTTTFEGFEAETTTTKPHAKVDLRVIEAGLSTYLDYSDSPTGTAGAVIENHGKEMLTSVEVIFTFKDDAGEPVATETSNIYGIEPGGTAFVALSSAELESTAHSVEVTTVVDSEVQEYYSATIVPVSDIQVRPGEYGGYEITGQASNPSGKVLDSVSVSCVVRSGGEIVGGTTGYLDTLAPSATIAWDASFDAGESVTIDAADCSASMYG